MMRYLLLLGSVALCAGCSEHRPDVGETEDARVAALLNNDIPALSALTADDFVHVNSEGRARGKAEFIAGREAGGRPFSLFENLETDTRYYGDTAIVMGRYQNAFAGTDPADAKQARFIRVYVWRDGRWQNVVHQATEVTEPE